MMKEEEKIKIVKEQLEDVTQKLAEVQFEIDKLPCSWPKLVGLKDLAIKKQNLEFERNRLIWLLNHLQSWRLL